MNSRLLAYEWVDPDNTRSADIVVMLHGILGQKRNLFGFARRFVGTFPKYSVLLVDLRNHGSSKGFERPHTLDTCAKDLEVLFNALNIAPKSIIGHSFGAGVALTFAGRTRKQLASLWLLDAVPALSHEFPRAMDPQLDKIFSALEHCPPAQSRQEFKACLQGQGISEALCSWLAMSFPPEPALAREMVEDLRSNYVVDDLDLRSSKTKLFLVQAERNLEWQGPVKARISHLEEEGRIKVLSLPNSGHWVHIDNPEGLLEMMATDFA